MRLQISRDVRELAERDEENSLRIAVRDRALCDRLRRDWRI